MPVVVSELGKYEKGRPLRTIQCYLGGPEKPTDAIHLSDDRKEIDTIKSSNQGYDKYA